MDDLDFEERRNARIHLTEDGRTNAAAYLYRKYILFKASNRAILKIAILPKPWPAQVVVCGRTAARQLRGRTADRRGLRHGLVRSTLLS